MLLVKKFENFKSRKNFNRVPSQGQCQLQIDTCHLLLQWLNSAAAATDLQYFLKGAQGGEQKWGTLCSGKTGKTGLQMVMDF